MPAQATACHTAMNATTDASGRAILGTPARRGACSGAAISVRTDTYVTFCVLEWLTGRPGGNSHAVSDSRAPLVPGSGVHRNTCAHGEFYPTRLMTRLMVQAMITVP